MAMETEVEGLSIGSEVKMGMMLAASDRASVLARARKMEASGLDSIWVGDHIAFHIPVIEPLSVLSFCASVTERIDLATGVLLLPLRHPTLTAKMTGTIDMLSNGRLVLGVGVGGEFPPEFEAVGSPIEERGSRTDEAIEILRRHWANEPDGDGKADFSGKHYQFGPVKVEPKPLRKGGPPIIVGGRKAVSMKRAGRLGDGYISHMCDVETYASNLSLIGKHARAAGRAGRPFQTTANLFTVLDDSYERAHKRAAKMLGTIYNTDFSDAAKRYCLLGKPEDCLEQMRAFAKAGCRHFVMSALSDPDEIIERASTDIIRDLRSIV